MCPALQHSPPELSLVHGHVEVNGLLRRVAEMSQDVEALGCPGSSFGDNGCTYKPMGTPVALSRCTRWAVWACEYKSRAALWCIVRGISLRGGLAEGWYGRKSGASRVRQCRGGEGGSSDSIRADLGSWRYGVTRVDRSVLYFEGPVVRANTNRRFDGLLGPDQ